MLHRQIQNGVPFFVIFCVRTYAVAAYSRANFFHPSHRQIPISPDQLGTLLLFDANRLSGFYGGGSRACIYLDSVLQAHPLAEQFASKIRGGSSDSGVIFLRIFLKPENISKYAASDLHSPISLLIETNQSRTISRH